MNENENNTVTKADYIKSIVFIIWIVFSAYLLFKYKLTPRSIFMVVGQFFFINFLSFSTGRNKILFIPMLFGLVLFLYGVGWNNLRSQIHWIPIIVLFIFLFTGIGFIFYAFYQIRIKKRCSLQIRATCIEVNSKTFRDQTNRFSVVYSPIYEAYFGGQKHVLCNNKYTDTQAKVGDVTDIYVNPENNSEFYDPRQSLLMIKALLFLGIIFIVFSAILLPVALKQFV